MHVAQSANGCVAACSLHCAVASYQCRVTSFSFSFFLSHIPITMAVIDQQQQPSSNNSQHPPSYQHSQLRVLSSHTNEPMSPQRPQPQMCNTNGYHYMSPPLPPSSDHNSRSMGINVSANYTNSHQQPSFNTIASNQSSQLLLLQSHHQQTSQSQPQQMQQPSHYNVASMRSYAQSPQANSPNGMASTPGPNPPAAHETTTTSDDSDDSTPHTTPICKVAGIKRPSRNRLRMTPKKFRRNLNLQKRRKKEILTSRK
ncbi:hypothetical protein U1Q18_048469, partial [Sarracenia purpurea var. burkii]